MGRLAVAVLAVSVIASQVVAAPILPVIKYHDFGIFAGPNATYLYEGNSPDRLIIPGSATPGIGENEVFTYTATVLPKSPTLPVYEVSPGINFGGDLSLNMLFDGSDGPFVGPGGIIDVSLTGHGGVDGADLIIRGAIGGPGGQPQGVLLAMEVTQASLYGLGGQPSLHLEATGTITQSAIPGLVGQPGAITGTIFGLSLPSGYTPAVYHDPTDMVFFTLNGEAGVIPEPATCLVGLLGGLMMLAGRRKGPPA
jgi:hypothetical protein